MIKYFYKYEKVRDPFSGRMFVEKSVFYKHLTPFGVKQNDKNQTYILFTANQIAKTTDIISNLR